MENEWYTQATPLLVHQVIARMCQAITLGHQEVSFPAGALQEDVVRLLNKKGYLYRVQQDQWVVYLKPHSPH
ncbi:MAG: hypothetical protein ACK4LB_13530 [Spirosomataceae bacterium]